VVSRQLVPVPIVARFPLAAARDAYAHLAAGGVKGKIVLTI
jgi:NADPH:quinone reductase-like Zn-dependent oxidoreductase